MLYGGVRLISVLRLAANYGVVFNVTPSSRVYHLRSGIDRKCEMIRVGSIVLLLCSVSLSTGEAPNKCTEFEVPFIGDKVESG